MDITKLSIQELKALAYDVSLQVKHLQNNLFLIESEIERKSKEQKNLPETQGEETNK